MSLIGWWPLNGDTKDYSGNNNHGEIVGNVVQDNNGKIGKSYCWNGDDENKHYIQIKNFLPEKMNEYTFAFWINSMNISKKQTILTSRDYNRGIQISLERYVAIYFDNENGSNMFSDFNDLESNQWYHIAISFNSEHNNIKTYVNGKFTSEDNMDCSLIKSLNSIRLGQRYYKDDAFYKPDTFNGNINDVRIYNHELSAGEIKELAKAKVLHYKFNNEYEEPTKNLVSGKQINLNAMAHPITLTRVPDENGWQKYSLSGKRDDSPSESWPDGTYPYSMYMDMFPLQRDEFLSYSFKIKTTCPEKFDNFGSATMVNIYYHPSKYYYSKKIDDYYHIEIGSAKPALSSAGTPYPDATLNQAVYLNSRPAKGITFNPKKDFILIKDFQVEKKQHCTPFTAANRNIKIGDSSGYRNHGDVNIENAPENKGDAKFRTGNFSRPLAETNIIKIPDNIKILNKRNIERRNDSNSIIGDTSFEFKDEDIITVDNFQFNREEFTISFWAKEYNLREAREGYVIWKNSCVLVHLNASTESDAIRFKIAGDPYWSDIHLVVNAPRQANTWNHFTFTFKKGIQKAYMNGRLLGSATAQFDHIAQSSYPLIIGKRADGEGSCFNGCLSDLKIYHTALSDEDILNDYQVKTKVRKTGSLETKQIIENKNLFNTDLIIRRYNELQINTNDLYKPKLVKEDNRNCLKISPIPFWNDPIKKIESIFNEDYFKAKTSYTIKITLKTNHFHQGKEVSAGFRVLYDDGTTNDTLYTITSNQWKTISITTDKNKNLHRFVTGYWIGEPFYVDLDRSYIVENTPANINKKGILTASEINEVDTLNLETKTEHGADWVRVFYHDCRSGAELFSNDFNEFLKCNTEYKKSDMWALEQFRGQDEKFEFLLEYKDIPGKYNRWKQSSNPVYEHINGYEEIKIDWSTSYWGGLEPNFGVNTDSWIDGSVNHSYWYYSIGSKHAWGEGMPAVGSPNMSTKNWVKLWVRCDNPEAFKIYKNGEIRATEFIEN